jgi:glycosyltransferase involved in cell wall biosynthesis
MPDTMQVGSAGPIAVVAHTHPSITKGGAEIAAFALYEGLRQNGVDAIFIAACPQADRARVALGSDREFLVLYDPLRYDHMYQISSADVWRQLRAILQREQVRLVSFHHFLNFGVNCFRALTAETKIPFTLTLHEFLAICNHFGQMVTRPARRLCQQATPMTCAQCFPEFTHQQFAMRATLIRNALLPAAAFVSPSHFLAKRMVEWGLPQERFVVIENGLRTVPRRAPGRRAAPPDSPWVFGYFGQITPFKGGDTLLDAVDILARQPGVERRIAIRVHGNLIGQTPEFGARFGAAFAKHPFISYAGPYDNAEVNALMAACDYVIMPSTWWENSPVVIQEAFAAGRPVICTGIGGMAEKVPDRRAGLHFRLGDGADLARVFEEACDPALYATLSAGLPEVSDRGQMARTYMDAFTRSGAYGPSPGAADWQRWVDPVTSAGL